MNRFEWLRAWLLARVPAEIAMVAAGVGWSSAQNELRRLKTAGLIGDGDEWAAERRVAARRARGASS